MVQNPLAEAAIARRQTVAAAAAAAAAGDDKNADYMEPSLTQAELYANGLVRGEYAGIAAAAAAGQGGGATVGNAPGNAVYYDADPVPGEENTAVYDELVDVTDGRGGGGDTGGGARGGGRGRATKVNTAEYVADGYNPAASDGGAGHSAPHVHGGIYVADGYPGCEAKVDKMSTMEKKLQQHVYGVYDGSARCAFFDRIVPRGCH
jgi:hypothetical protein